MMINNQRANNGAIDSDRFTGNGPDADVQMIKIVEANTRSVNEYEPQPHDQPIMVFRAEESFWYSKEGLTQGLGWARIAAGGLPSEAFQETICRS